MVWESAALVILLASTWLIVASSLHEASPAVVSAGRTGFTVLGLLALTWWSTFRTTTTSSSVGGRGALTATPRYRWWQVVLLALTGVTAYTVLSTVAINLAGPALPTLVMALTPAVVLVAEGLLTRTRPPARTILGTAIAVVGAVIYVLPRLAGTLGASAGLGSLFAVVAIPLAIWAAMGLAAGDTVSWTSIGLLAFLGIVVYVPAYLLQHRILLTGGPSYSALLGLATPLLVGVSSAVLQLAAIPAPLQIVGMALTLFGMFLVVRRKLKPIRVPEPAKETVS